MTSLLPFDTFTLAAVASELREALEDARVQKVQQPTANEVTLAFYGRGGAHRLLLCADPRLFRAHLTQIKRENPQQPLGFCQVARKYLEGARLDDVRMPHFDRVLHLVFESGEFGRVVLIAELMGRNANLVLANGHEGGETVRGVLRPVPANDTREVRPGVAYSDPPGFHDRVDPLTLDGPRDAFFHDMPAEAENLRPWLGATFTGIGRFAADEILARAGHSRERLPDALTAFLDDVRTDEFAPHHVMDEQGHTVGAWPFSPLSVPPGRAFARESISVALDTLYATVAERGVEEGEHTTLLKAVAREIAYRERELKSARATLAEAGRAEDYERLGNLLLANLAFVPRGEPFVTVPDLYASEEGLEAGIALDPKKSPQENAQSYFDRARKARDAAEYAEGRAADMEDERAQLDGLRAQLDNGATHTNEEFARIRALLEEIVGTERVGAPAGAAAKKTKVGERPYAGHRVRSYDLDGYTLLVGESAEANDFLMTRVASPSDLWMHVRAGTGAHGVLRTGGKPDRVPDVVVRQAAATVAARSGSVKHSGLVAVDVTERRYVRKPRGAKPGLALYDRARTYDVTPRLPRDRDAPE